MNKASILLRLSTFKRIADTKPVCAELPLSDWQQRLTRFNIRDEKDGPLYSPAIWGTGYKRGNDGITRLTAVVLDCEKTAPPFAELRPRLEGKASIWHTTHRHSFESERYRVILPLSRPVSPEEWPSIHRGAVRFLELDGRIDPTCAEPARAYYAASCSPENEADRFSGFTDGDLWNPDELLGLVADEPSPAEFTEDAIASKKSVGGRPGDDFNQRATWDEILSPHGWRRVFEGKGVAKWVKPGDPGHDHQATTNHAGSDLFYCFSPDAPPMPCGKAVSKFAVYTLLNHGGNFSDATRELGKQGYGEPIGNHSPAHESLPEPTSGSGPNQFEGALARLSALSPLQYDVVRKAEAKALGVRPGTLDVAVKNARKTGEDDSLPFLEVEPWPDPVEPAKLLTDIATTIRRFIVCNEEVAHAVALWVALTWFIDVIQVAPLAVITAPEKRCGKSMLLFLLGRLSARAITASSISPAALFRTIDAWQPTLLIDEADAFMKDNEELRGLLNSGHTRDSAYVIRTVGENFTPTKFNTWGAKALAGIGHVADTLMDRAVILELRRKLPHEKTERLRHAEPGLFEGLSSKLARFADDYSEQVRQARPPLPESLNDRAQDNWEGLLAIAMMGGEEWLRIGTTAALKLSGGDSASQTIGTELLSDIQEIFEEKHIDRISTAELIKSICADDEKPWATYNRLLKFK
jgi:hypothetical protein